MTLWLLRPVGYTPKEGPWSAEEIPDSPWSSWYDRNWGFVIRAPDETAARDLAHQASHDGMEWCFTEDPWLNPALTNCTPLPPDGDAGVIMTDFRAG